MFRTFGAAIKSLSMYLLPVRLEVHAKHYSTPQYFVEKNLAIHRGFEAWCLENWYQPVQMNELRIAIVDHCVKYGQPELFVLECLTTHLPDEYNVRGKWTPTSLK